MCCNLFGNKRFKHKTVFTEYSLATEQSSHRDHNVTVPGTSDSDI